MSLKFVTRKLKTQKLEEQEQQQKKLEQVDKFKNEVPVQETVVLTETAIVSTLFNFTITLFSDRLFNYFILFTMRKSLLN